jgi:hypothetical protein
VTLGLHGWLLLHASRASRGGRTGRRLEFGGSHVGRCGGVATPSASTFGRGPSTAVGRLEGVRTATCHPFCCVARLGACLFRAPHVTELPTIEVVFPVADVPLRTLELPDLRGDRVTTEAPVIPPRLDVASALGSASTSMAAFMASPGTMTVGRAAEFCSFISR